MTCPLIGLLLTLVLSLLAAPYTAEAQRPTARSRIGYIRGSAVADAVRHGEMLRQGLRDLRYLEGQHFTLETRAAEGHYDRLPAMAAELVRLPVDVIVAAGVPAIRAATQATSTIPIVMASTFDPVGEGLVTSLSQPGGNVTGVALGPGEHFAGKWVELLKEAVPQVAQVAVLWDARGSPSEPVQRLLVRETERVAAALGLQLHLVEVRELKELDGAFAALTRAGAEALIVLTSARFWTERQRLVALAAQHRLPAMYEHRDFAEAGGLMAYGANMLALTRRAAYYVDRLLQGVKPADLPVEQPTKFELVINLKTAHALGLPIPQQASFRRTR
jgi:putative ABC transport system substrate-binding protein